MQWHEMLISSMKAKSAQRISKLQISRLGMLISKISSTKTPQRNNNSLTTTLDIKYLTQDTPSFRVKMALFCQPSFFLKQDAYCTPLMASFCSLA